MSDGKGAPHSLHIPLDADNDLAADFERVRQAQAERNATGKTGGKGFDPSSQRTNSDKVSLSENFDKELYGDESKDKYAGYHSSIPAADDEDEDMDMDGEGGGGGRTLVGQYTATSAQINEWAQGGTAEDDILDSREKQAQIANRETDYQKRRFKRELSPGRGEDRSYREVMAEREIEREEERVQRLLEDKKKEAIAKGDDDEMDGVEHQATLKDDSGENGANGTKAVEAPKPRAKKRRWDTAKTVDGSEANGDAAVNGEADTNGHAADGEGPLKKSRWNVEPEPVSAPAAPTKRSKWDMVSTQDSAAPNGGVNGAATPAPGVMTFGTDVSSRNAPLSDEELNEMLPSEGYKILDPPPGYEPLRAPAKRLAPPQTPVNTGGFMMQEPVDARQMGKQLPSDIPGVGDLQFFKAEDMAYFGKLVDNADENEMSVDELKERKIMRLLLKVKNGTPPMRKTALRHITDNARVFGAGPLFDQILPLLMEKSLEDQERHLLVKVIDRVLYKLDDLVRPYVHKILVVIEPLLIDQDYYARVEGREIISNLSKAAGLAHMISTMRPDIDHQDEYVRNTTARAFAVVASALGIPTLLPFLKAVCKSKKSWQARHTGVKIIQQIPILMGCAVLPHLKGLVDCIGDNLNDEQMKVRTVTSLALAALAEASNPFGIESFDPILHSLWTGARKQRGKGLAGFLKAVGYIIPLMDEEYSNYFTSQIMEVLLREFQSPDEEMKKVVLKVISQCSGTSGVTSAYLKETVLPDFFKSFWVRRMALDKRNYKQVVETTVDLGNKVGVGEIVERIVNNLKDESEAYRKMTVETIEKVISAMGAADINERLEERLVDGILHAFQEQSVEDIVLLNGFGTVVNALGTRCKPYLPQIVSTILWRLNNKSATVRQQAADLVTRIAIVMKQCGEDGLMGKLGTVLYEYLGEEYPEVLGSILGAMRSIVTVVGISSMQPPIRDLLPRLTPILRNRHEKVQENTIDLVGRIADRGPESVNAREWMRICFELLDMLKAHKKGIRRAANNTFGFIAKAIGPQDVLATLLNNLRVQERQSRVCTAVAIGIVAETCAPFTVLPALMNEYRVPELNVQNGVLKSLSFLFEYIGEMAKDYVYAVTPLLEDALVDRDQVHRQTAASVVKHVALGVVGLGCEDAMLHLLNLLYPNLFETSPHVIDRVIEAIDAVRLAVGTGVVMNYVWAGLFHPARKARKQFDSIADDVERHFDLVASHLREWIPHETPLSRPSPAPLPPPTTLQVAQRWIARNRAVSAAVLAFLVTGSVGGWVYVRSQRSRRKRRARKSPSGARTDVVVVAGGVADPLTSALYLDLERRGYVVYVVANTAEDERYIRSQSRADLLPLQLDLVDPGRAGQQMRRFGELLGREHRAFEGAEAHLLRFVGLVVVPSTSSPEPARIEEVGSEEWSDALNAKVLNTIATAQLFLPAVVAQKAKILLLAPSVTPALKLPGHAVQSTVYGALEGFTSTLSAEMLEEGVSVSKFKLGNIDIPAVTAKQRREAAGGQAVSRVKATPVRKLQDAVFDALVARPGRGRGTWYVGRGSLAYEVVGNWVPQGVVGWMMGGRSRARGVEEREEEGMGSSAGSLTWEKVEQEE
ncbi:U2 snRNP component prp10 [Saxophila tyrrhenica]|uniref:U2 snRNP component prp10 n=1 Tax=Saxophila tyrrhenica TaxID=1690608 RepID=A0AAV9PJ00_9PEZI|nr:U2 snRNP component prp10 [Saxophila tyrrhenica]